MAIVTLSVTSPTEGFPWSVNFDVSSTAAIRDIPTSPTYPSFEITCTTNNYGTFIVPSTGVIRNVMNGFSSHNGGGIPSIAASSTDDSYITWRSSTSTSGQFPTSGRSMDIWSYQFYNDIMFNNYNWSTMLASYPLSSTKWSLIYDYSTRTSFVWSKGGTLTVSVV